MNLRYHNTATGGTKSPILSGINPTSVDIDKNSGILFEIDTNYDEQYKFHSEIYDLPVMVKDPDFNELSEDNLEGLSPEQRLEMWQNDFNCAERMIADGKGFEAFDLDCFVNYILVYNILKNNELTHPKSLYIHKLNLDSKSKYYFGPVWDFDGCLNMHAIQNGEIVTSMWEESACVHKFINDLINMPEFMQKYKERFYWFMEEVYPSMLKFIDDYSEMVSKSAFLDGNRWNSTEDFGWVLREPANNQLKKVAELKDWLIKHIYFLKSRVDQNLF